MDFALFEIRHAVVIVGQWGMVESYWLDQVMAQGVIDRDLIRFLADYGSQQHVTIGGLVAVLSVSGVKSPFQVRG